MMEMDTNVMMGSVGGTMMFFGWLIYLLTIALLVLGIIALAKYIGRDK